jgi:excisionase family DNA binding protein
MPVTERYRTVPQIARELLVSRRTIYRAIARGELRAVRIGERGRLRVPVEALERLIRPARPLQHDRDHEKETGR